MARHWSNKEVHFWWESPLMAALLLLSMACVAVVI